MSRSSALAVVRELVVGVLCLSGCGGTSAAEAAPPAATQEAEASAAELAPSDGSAPAKAAKADGAQADGGKPNAVADAAAEGPARLPAITEVDDLPAKRNLLGEHYPASNERRIDMFRSHVEELGGGYVGVGTDQNLTFIAWARSSHAWLMDFDPVVVMTNRIHFALIEASETFADFRAHWDAERKDQTYALLKDTFGDDATFERAWQVAWQSKIGVPSRLRDLDRMSERFDLRTFNNDPEDYTHVRTLVLEGRILAVGGDLTGAETMRTISRDAEKLGVAIRVLYLSNAEEYMRYPQPMRDNVLALPIDDNGKVLRTVTKRAREFGVPRGEKSWSYPFHYNVQGLESFKDWMRFRRFLSVTHLVEKSTKLQRGLSNLDEAPADVGLRETGRITRYRRG